MRAIVEENFDMADKEIQATVCDVGEPADSEDEGLTEQDGEEFSK